MSNYAKIGSNTMSAKDDDDKVEEIVDDESKEQYRGI